MARNGAIFGVSFSAVLLLAGCTTQQQAGEAAAKKAQRAAAQDQADDAQCRSYGTPAGSDGYEKCRRILAKGRIDDE
jgi:outer membrane biogenesis lipoprotein LolB